MELSVAATPGQVYGVKELGADGVEGGGRMENGVGVIGGSATQSCRDAAKGGARL